MSVLLIDEDRAEIARVCYDGIPELANREVCYLAGVRTGMERAAVIAKAALAEKMNVGPMWIYHRNVELAILGSIKE